MSEGSDLQPRIIKKIKKHEGGHSGAWKVAYADFVTAMMALFIVLWVLSQDQNVKQLVANYFKNPIGFTNKGKSLLGTDKPQLDQTMKPSIPNPHQKEMQLLKAMGDKILGELTQDATFKNIVGQIKIEFVKEGLKIEIVDSAKDLFFEIGTAKLTKEAELLLMKIGNQRNCQTKL